MLKIKDRNRHIDKILSESNLLKYASFPSICHQIDEPALFVIIVTPGVEYLNCLESRSSSEVICFLINSIKNNTNWLKYYFI